LGIRIRIQEGLGMDSNFNLGSIPEVRERESHSYTDKKENQIFLIPVYKEIQWSGAVAKSHICMRKGFLVYEEMRKYFPIYEEAVVAGIFASVSS
jgi:hypothetical protein